jgi:hypothetical protein
MFATEEAVKASLADAEEIFTSSVPIGEQSYLQKMFRKRRFRYGGR